MSDLSQNCVCFPSSYLPRKCLIYLINVLHPSEMSRLSQKCFTSLRNHLLCLRNVAFPLEMSGFTSEMSHFPQKIPFYSAINRSPPQMAPPHRNRPWGKAGKGGRVLHDFPQETFIQKHFFSPLNIYIFLPFFWSVNVGFQSNFSVFFKPR